EAGTLVFLKRIKGDDAVRGVHACSWHGTGHFDGAVGSFGAARNGERMDVVIIIGRCRTRDRRMDTHIKRPRIRINDLSAGNSHDRHDVRVVASGETIAELIAITGS